MRDRQHRCALLSPSTELGAVWAVVWVSGWVMARDMMDMRAEPRVLSTNCLRKLDPKSVHSVLVQGAHVGYSSSPGHHFSGGDHGMWQLCRLTPDTDW